MIEQAKVLTVRGPWANLMFAQLNPKDVENRTWRTNYCGPLLIQVSLMSRSQWAREWAHANGRAIAAGCRVEPGVVCPQFNSSRGHIIGIVDLVRVTDSSSSVWADEGAWHWRLARPVLLPTPIAWKGALGLMPAPSDVIAEVNRQLAGREV